LARPYGMLLNVATKRRLSNFNAGRVAGSVFHSLPSAFFGGAPSRAIGASPGLHFAVAPLKKAPTPPPPPPPPREPSDPPPLETPAAGGSPMATAGNTSTSSTNERSASANH